jgi:hypothetical protein
MIMVIHHTDTFRLSLLKKLCETSNDFLFRTGLADKISTLDDSPLENLAAILRVIGIVSTWLTPAFKNATQTKMMWGCLANLRNNYYSEYDNARSSETDLDIAKNDIRVLNELCGQWLETGDTETQPLQKMGVW